MNMFRKIVKECAWKKIEPAFDKGRAEFGYFFMIFSCMGDLLLCLLAGCATCSL